MPEAVGAGLVEPDPVMRVGGCGVFVIDGALGVMLDPMRVEPDIVAPDRRALDAVLIRVENREPLIEAAPAGDAVRGMAAEADACTGAGAACLAVVATIGAVTSAHAMTPAAILVPRFHVCGCESTMAPCCATTSGNLRTVRAARSSSPPASAFAGIRNGSRAARCFGFSARFAEVAVDELDGGAAGLGQVAHGGVCNAEGVARPADERVDGSRSRLEGLGHVLGRLPVDLAHDEGGAVPGAHRAQRQEDVARVGAGEDLVGGVGRLQLVPRQRLLLDAGVLGGTGALADRVDHDVARDREQPRARVIDAAGLGAQELHEDFLRRVGGRLRGERPREAVAVDALVVAAVDLGEGDGVPSQGPVEDAFVREPAGAPCAECE
jgi:hypothetical protein